MTDWHVGPSELLSQFNMIPRFSTLSPFSRLAAIGLAVVLTGAQTFAVDVSAPATNGVPAKPNTSATAKKAEKSSKEDAPYPFHGTVASVDKKAMSISLEGKEHQRILTINADSHLDKGGKPATLTDIVAGDYLHGRVEKKNGHEVVVKATAGPKPEKKADAPKKKDEARLVKKTTAEQ